MSFPRIMFLAILLCATGALSQEIEKLKDPVTFESLVEFIKNHPEIKTPQALEKHLSPALENNHIEFYDTGSNHEADNENPRKLHFNKDGTLTVAYQTKPGGKFYLSMETKNWDPVKEEDIFRSIKFGSDPKEPRYEVGEANSKDCRGCHQHSSGQLIGKWDSYEYWPGTAPGGNSARTQPIIAYTSFSNELNFKRFFHQLEKHPVYQQYKFVVLAGLACISGAADRSSDWLDFSYGSEKGDEYEFHKKWLKPSFGDSPLWKEMVDEVKANPKLPQKVQDVGDFIHIQILKHFGIWPEHPFLNFRTPFGISTGGNGNLALLGELVRRDPELNKLYGKFLIKVDGSGPYAYSENQLKLDNESKECEDLRKRSAEALKHFDGLPKQKENDLQNQNRSHAK